MGEENLSKHAVAERDAIIAEIHAAFRDVRRGPAAMSWQQTIAASLYQDVVAARDLDTDTRWTELVDDETWQPFPGAGGFAYLNVEGFQYYLPPTMIRNLRLQDRGSVSGAGHLIEELDRFMSDPDSGDAHSSTWVFVPTGEPARVTWMPAQMRCIARFMSWMGKHDPHSEIFELIGDENPWRASLERKWKQWLRD